MKLGNTSLKHLQGLHPELLKVVYKTVDKCTQLGLDFSIVDGVRSLKEAQANVAKGVSQTLNSKHLPQKDGLGWAFDFKPYPSVMHGIQVDGVNWMTTPESFGRWITIITLFKLSAAELGVKIRCGIDWDSDGNYREHSMPDAYHIEKL